MTAHIETIAIGGELLNGTISDTNSTFVARVLFGHGYCLKRTNAIADDKHSIKETIRECADRSDYVFCFGGLGPTSDDLTAEAVVDFLGGGLVCHEASRERLAAKYKKFGRELTPQSLKQTYYPKDSLPIDNWVGMSPGFTFKVKKCSFYFFPGVPREMERMFTKEVLPQMLKAEKLTHGPARILSQVWKCIGITEANLQAQLDPVETKFGSQAWLGYRTHYPENHVVLYYRHRSLSECKGFEEIKTEIHSVVKPWCFTKENLELEEVVINELRKKGLQIALVESCTGGLVSRRLISVAGASDVVWGAAVAYQVKAKKALLGVELENESDAVSKECTRRLAESALKLSSCSIAAAVTGYLGPSGGTEQDPVGTIYICVASQKDNSTLSGAKTEKRFILPIRERTLAQRGAAAHVLNEILKFLR